MRLYTTDAGLSSPRAWLQRRTLVMPDMLGEDGFVLPGRPPIKRRVRQAVTRWR